LDPQMPPSDSARAPQRLLAAAPSGGGAPGKAPQANVVCPYCRKPLTTRADGSFSCARCGEFPNYGRMYTAPPR